MSRENMQLVRDSSQAFAEGGMEAMAAYWAPDIVWRAIEGAPDDVGEMHGPDAARRYVQDWIDTFENITNVIEELIEAGEDRVLATHHVTGRARRSGVETELRYAVLYTLRDGRIARVREYGDRAQALEAAGLRP